MPTKAPARSLAQALVLLIVLLGTATQADDSSRLFHRVDGPDGGPPCWLLGTIHASDPRVLALPPPVMQAFDAAQVFVLEAVLDSEATAQMMAAMRFEDGRTLDAALPRQLYQATVEALAEQGLPEAAARGLKPWAAMIILSLPQGPPGPVLDMQLLAEASAAGKAVVGLEQPEEQLAIFDQLSVDEQRLMLEQALAGRASRDERYDALVAAYLNGDLGALEALKEDELGDLPPALIERFHALAIDMRNERMIARLQPLLRQGDCFIAVGALHFPGETGLLQGLTELGYQLSPVH